ncbi:MAG: Thiamine biosynthesis lipoprotein ApbE precursor [Verrucomicrobiota bacterium]|jgi:thiamine biosynthesis lipoprotein
MVTKSAEGAKTLGSFLRLLCFLWLTCRGAAAAEPVALTGHAMGTTWSVKFLPPPTPLDPSALSQKISARLEILEQQFSTYRPASELSRFNATASTDWFPVSPELVQVAVESLRLSALTRGAFDPSVAPLLSLWGFGPHARAGAAPSAAEVAAARVLVDWRRLEARVAPPALRKSSPALAVDCSSMAKGLAVDALGELFLALGAPDHFVQIGGDLRAAGHAADGREWRAGIEAPVAAAIAPERAPLAGVVVLAGAALSTSGNHRNTTTRGGRALGHIVAPASGRPVEHGLVSVSVVAPTCAQSSALATALFVLGPAEGLRFATDQRIACVFHAVDAAGKIRATPSPEFRRRIVFSAPP